MDQPSRPPGVQQPSPTPEQIAERAAEIRARWSDDEHYRRAGLEPPTWTPPRAAFDETQPVGPSDE